MYENVKPLHCTKALYEKAKEVEEARNIGDTRYLEYDDEFWADVNGHFDDINQWG